MGCFNKMGFYSHLPITAGDEIMLFICINNSKQYDIDVNMEISDGMFTPICLPICGKYDEYGKIEEIIAKWKEFTGIELKIADEETLNKSVNNK